MIYLKGNWYNHFMMMMRVVQLIDAAGTTLFKVEII